MRAIRSLVWLFAIGLVLCVGGSRCEAEEGWSLKKLWPGGKETSRRSRIRQASWAQLPGQELRKASSSRSTSDATTILDRMAAGPKTVWEKTKELVTPESKKKRTTSDALRRRQPKKTSGLGRWFGLGKSEPRTRTISSPIDFLGQERPRL